MGNSCKCFSKINSINKGKKVKTNRPLPTKKDKSKSLKWEKILKPFSSYENPIQAFKNQNTADFCRYLLEGPPSELRWDVWLTMLSINPKKINLEISIPEDIYSIEKDLTRTFPNHPFFTNPRGQCALKNVLVSMVNNHPELGYCQGMNSVAGVLLIVSKGNEVESLGILESICMKLGGKGLFEYGFPLVKDFCAQFHEELEEKIPDVFTFFKDIELDDNFWITKWFMTIFSYSFHLDCVVRIWDAVFAYGLGFMVNIALAMIRYLKLDFLGKTFEEILEYLPEIKEMYVDIDAVLLDGVNFKFRNVDINIESEVCSETLKDEVDKDEKIVTKWEAANYTYQNSRSIMEEFSLLSPSNLSKFTV
ncbi:hypothetical protein SteCoe_9797 [Stentor coeruleus]|uniref:Rab-GAP TBC domain-containing protein n=1 Tax=Stentor coeruleus TaxID=5963 RepID=A0A1R2CH33_9CILI|nr:hypothetical protein SteCoe_9797 [Stentor coeruleus]